MNLFLKTFSLGLCCLLLSCSQETPKLAAEREILREKIRGSTVENPQVDILFVVDDSGSMNIHQDNLSRNIDLFVEKIQKNKTIDFHFGVITTDNDLTNRSGRLISSPRVITRKTTDWVNVLRSSLKPGTSGAGTEVVFDTTIAALTPPISTGDNLGFLRSSAFLALIIVTDAEDQSKKVTSGSEFYNRLLGIKNGHADKLITYGAIVPAAGNNCTRDESYSPAFRIEEFFAASKGSAFGLCDPDFGSKLSLIGRDLALRVSRKIPLEQIPRLESVEVKFGTQIIPRGDPFGWSFLVNDNAIVLGDEVNFEEQPSGTKIEIEYLPLNRD